MRRWKIISVFTKDVFYVQVSVAFSMLPGHLLLLRYVVPPDFLGIRFSHIFQKKMYHM